MPLVFNAVVEGVFLFLNLQCKQLSRPALKQLSPSLVVAIDTRQPPAEDGTSCQTCTIQVQASGLGAYFLDGAAFIKQLCELCPNLLQHSSIQSSTLNEPSADSPIMEILCRCIGEPGKVTRYSLDGWTAGESSEDREPLVRESVVTRPSDLHPAALCVKLITLVKKDLKETGHELSRLLHLIQIVNPKVVLRLCVRDCTNECILKTAYETTGLKTLSRGPFKLVISASHYIKLRPELSLVSKLQLLKGDDLILPDAVLLQDGRRVSLRLFSMVAVLPCLRLKQNKKVPINRLCDKLRMFIYGPHSLPLVQPGSNAAFPLSSLAEWEHYGITPIQASSPTTQADHAVAVPSYICDLSNSRQSTSTIQPSPKHTLLLFLFLEDTTSTERSSLSNTIQLRQQIELVHKLRGKLQEIVISQSKKFKKATHTSLNKLACNYGVYSKVKSIIGTALPLLADAVHSIVKNSADETFRDFCLETLQVDSEEGVPGRVEQCLWRIAKTKIGVTKSTDGSSKNPDEPTTPELALAVQSDQGTSQAHIAATNPQDEQVVGVQGPTTTEDNASHSQASTQDSGQTPSGEANTQVHNTQSLYRARIANKKNICNSVEKPEASLVQTSDDEDTCFDSLCDLDEEITFPNESEQQPSSQCEGDSQPSQPMIGAALFPCTVNSAQGHVSQTETVHQSLSPQQQDFPQHAQPMIGAAVNPTLDFVCEHTEEMSVSSFEELENFSECGDSFIEGMDYESHSDEETGYGDLALYEDETSIPSNTRTSDVSGACNNSTSSPWAHTINLSMSTPQESLAFLPKEQAKGEQGTDTSQGDTTSDDDWDCVLTCNASVPNNGVLDTDTMMKDMLESEQFPLLTNNAPDQDTNIKPTVQPSFSGLDINDNDFEWD